MTTSDLRNDIADALGLGHGTAGKVLQAVETYILADNYIAPHRDEQNVDHDLSWPMLLHTGTGRRFQILVREIESDTPPAPPGIGELTGEPTPAPGTFTPPEVLAQGPVPEPTPTPPPQPEQQVERPEPIQAPVHALQGEPEANVPADFFLRVEQIDAQIKPGEPLPTPEQ